MTLGVLRRQIDASKTMTAAHSYATCIEKYFVPYFGQRQLEDLTRNGIVEFELWRERQMGNSAAMIERHYSKLTATMAAASLS